MTTTGKLHGATIADGKKVISFEVDSDAGLTELMQGDMLDIKAEKHRTKRSLDANAYMWVLIDRLSKAIGLPKSEVYKQSIMEAGVMKTAVVKANIATDVANYLTDTKPSGTGDFALVGATRKDWTELYIYIGSSKYNTKEMSQLIEYIVDECKEQGIETKTPEEIAELIARWGNA